MADLSLRVKADFDEASRQFKALAESSEETRNKIEKFSESFETKHVESFIDKQKLLETSLTGTRGETDAMQQAANNYQKEIERLIKSGLDPNSEAVQRLANEHQKLKDRIKEANEVQKAQKDLMIMAEKAALACYAAIGAGIAAIVAMTHKTAQMGDQFAKTSRKVGMTAETFQELQYAANQSGIKDITPHLTRLSRTMVDVRNGTGALTKYLENNNEALLSQVQNAKSNEEAFNLLMDEIAKAPNEFVKAEIATAAFGRAGLDLINMAQDGVEGIAELREEARKYGVMSNEAAEASEKYMDAQTRLKAALQGVQMELTAEFLPGITDVVNKVADSIAAFDDWERVITIAGYALVGLTAGLTAFLIITKGAAAINTLKNAFIGLNKAIAANPIGAIAVVITAVLIPALIALYRNWDMVKTYLEQGLAHIEYAFKWLGSVIKEIFIIAFNTVRAAGATLVDFIYGNIIRSVGNMLEIMGRLPFVGQMFDNASRAVMRLGNNIGNMAAEARAASNEAIATARTEREETNETLRTKLDAINQAAEARRADLRERRQEIEDTAEEELEILLQAEEAKQELLEQYGIQSLKTFKERLNEIALTERQEQNERITDVEQFLAQRAALHTSDFEERIAFIQQQRDILLEEIALTAEEKIAIEQAANNAVMSVQEEMADYEQMLLQQRLSAFKQFTNGIGKLFDTLGKKNIAFAIMGKAVAAAEAAINTALAFTKALAFAPPPLNYLAAGGVMAAGVAQQIKIASTPIPTAETGGRFIVPDVSPRIDGIGLRVNPGERIDVTPRGEAGSGQTLHQIFNIDKQPFFDLINSGLRSGDIYEYSPAWNLA